MTSRRQDAVDIVVVSNQHADTLADVGRGRPQPDSVVIPPRWTVRSFSVHSRTVWSFIVHSRIVWSSDPAGQWGRMTQPDSVVIHRPQPDSVVIGPGRQYRAVVADSHRVDSALVISQHVQLVRLLRFRFHFRFRLTDAAHRYTCLSLSLSSLSSATELLPISVDLSTNTTRTADIQDANNVMTHSQHSLLL